jgi:hypothetical protein
VAQVYPRALGFLSVASYDSQGYGGGILSRRPDWLSIVIYMRSLLLVENFENVFVPSKSPIRV